MVKQLHFYGHSTVNQRAVFASKQRGLLPAALMPGLIAGGYNNFHITSGC